MRRTSPYMNRRSELDVTMTPMIDVVFLLLVFFVWTASFHIVEHVLPSQLSAAAGTTPTPTDEPPPEADFENVVVRIYWRGDAPTWSINETSVADLSEIRGRLAAIYQIKDDAPVIVHPDPDVPLGDVIDVYDLSHIVGFDQVRFAASEQL